MKIFFLFIIGLIACQHVLSQEFISEENRKAINQLVILEDLNVTQDSILVKMLNWHVRENKKNNNMDGFRVEIFFSSELDAYEQAKRNKIDFLQKYPDYPVHIKYNAPNFKVRIGDFRTENEALKLLKTIQGNYPMAFIVPDKIKFPLLKQVDYE